MSKPMKIFEAAIAVCLKYNTRCFGLGNEVFLKEVYQLVGREYTTRAKAQKLIGQALENSCSFSKKTYTQRGKQTRGFVLYPTWICSDCGSQYCHGWPDGHCATFHPDICDVCFGYKECTEPRDYGHLRNDGEWLKRVHPMEFIKYDNRKKV